MTKEEVQELDEWRKTSVQEEKYVDYLLGNRWRYGIIKKIMIKEDNQGQQYNVLHIAPCMEGMYPTHRSSRNKHSDIDDSYQYYDDFIFTSATYGQITKPATKSMMHKPHMMKWRKDIKKDSKCDILDSVHKWYTTTVLHVDRGANRFKINYDGWSSRYDEYIWRYVNYVL